MAGVANPEGGVNTQGGRRSGYHIQPENVGPAPSEYWAEDEAKRYHGTPKASLIQAELTHSVISVSGLRRNLGIVLDLGAGGGLSTLSFQALVAESCISGPPFVVGVDASPAMLATISSTTDVTGISVPALAGEGVASGNLQKCNRVKIEDGVRWCKARSDLVLADLAQPLPFRRSIADGVFSVSAVQWLLDERPKDAKIQLCTEDDSGVKNQGHDEDVSPLANAARCQSMTCPDGVHLGPQSRLRQLFHCLRKIVVPIARLAFQFYPPKGDHDFGARALMAAAAVEGFDSEVVLDFPHKGASKKWILVAKAFADRSNIKVRDSLARPWCALCWPVTAARCALQTGSVGTVAYHNNDVQARLQHQHFELALRLARQGRRLIENQGTDVSPESSKIRQRLEQELHPLQRTLACSLAHLLNRQEDIESSEPRKRKLEELIDATTGASQSSKFIAMENVAGTTASDVTEVLPGNAQPTRTQLREILLERIDEVLSILHQAPDASWRDPSPPLNTLTTSGL